MCFECLRGLVPVNQGCPSKTGKAEFIFVATMLSFNLQAPLPLKSVIATIPMSACIHTHNSPSYVLLPSSRLLHQLAEMHTGRPWVYRWQKPRHCVTPNKGIFILKDIVWGDNTLLWQTETRMVEFQPQKQVTRGSASEIVGPSGEICALYFYSELPFLLMNNITLAPVTVKNLASNVTAPGPVLCWAMSLCHGCQVHMP